MLITNTIQLKYLWLVLVTMQVEFLESNALLLQHVVKPMINAIITRKKWLDKALTTQKVTETSQKPC